jgi:PIN domain nuclease of toxin-antitoxin system
VILLDTHVLLWLDSDAPQLGAQARQAIQEAWQADQVVVSAISFWEAAMLQQRGRLSLAATPATWRDDWQEAGLRELPLNSSIALAAVALRDFHMDPADRFITATALAHDALLITADQAILNWPDRSLNRLNARH